ncbi:MAG: PAS domain-containing protein [Hoeflea sp.]|uniref:sensor histidine kinase n=1 Tax=Hoeflea sp. TaxID=1940281 RepID=UPI001DEA66F1|nr:PAS domain-containing sensor histidine kinase [Hoeflea sp.]MBU4529215.1 PAS domain-containing protein [Alphaproteobacteria bacterium]MBU4543619.1 PAS domain-containing protein [Alphaproteobacteria bacterium]MBU4549245.1 PAS domain-containing protein [Alphaproteobacteria bacterium]MBV1725378.1 PAS domain-containing protein [Hoeflea sp.]MBV1785341.1 PAS domain-containing protein [Hoeflea sp.]
MPLNSLKESHRLSFVLAGLRNAGVSMIYQDLNLTIRFCANLPELWPKEVEVIGKSDTALFGEMQAARIGVAKREVINTGEASKLEVLREVDQKRRWYLLHMDPDPDDSGAIIGVVTTILDIDDLKYRETVLRTLLRELNHRSKNLLAIIQSIASQTARSTHDLDEFLFAFRNRIQSMAQSQDLVTASDWRGAELFELTKSQLRPLVGENPPGFSMAGEDAYLLPNAALHLGLALHELTINSLATGALGPAGGEIVLSAERRLNGNNQTELVVTWTETFLVPPVAIGLPPAHGTGFSGTVLKRIVPQALSASVRHEASDSQIVYELTIPDTQYELN